MSAESAGPRGALLLAAGRVRDAIPALESARAHDPLAPGYASFLSLAYLANGDHRSALAEIDRGLQLEGLHENLLSSGFSIALASRDRAEIVGGSLHSPTKFPLRESTVDWRNSSTDPRTPRPKFTRW